MSGRPAAVTRWRSWCGRSGRARAARAGGRQGSTQRAGGRPGGQARWSACRHSGGWRCGRSGEGVSGRGGRQEVGRVARGQGRLAGDIYLILPHHEPWCVRAAPRSVARQTLLHHRSAASVFATSPSCRVTMHDAAQTFRRAMTIGAAKSVS